MPRWPRRSLILGILILAAVLGSFAAGLAVRGVPPPFALPCLASCPPPSADLSQLADGGGVADERFGVIATGNVDHALAALGVRWWYSFDSALTATSGHHVLAVALRPTHGAVPRRPASELEAVARANPGSYWLIGNEPNVPGQDNISPEKYVDELRYYTTTIHGADPTARFVGPNVLNVDATCSDCAGFMPGRTWVKRFVDSWTKQTGSDPPFDAWGIHVYTITWDDLPMVDTPTVEREVASFSDLLGTLPTERAKPVWLTEFGVIWGYPGADSVPDGCSLPPDCLRPTGSFAAEKIESNLSQLLDWLSASSARYRLGRWFLYTTYGQPEPYATAYAGISLLDAPSATGGLTRFGQIYRSDATKVRPR